MGIPWALVQDPKGPREQPLVALSLSLFANPRALR